MDIIYLDQPLDDTERAALLFAGHLLIYRNIPAMRQLIDETDQQLRHILGGLDPVFAQHQLSPEQFLQLTGEAQTAFRTSGHNRALFFQALAQCGVDLSQTCYDHFPMRIVPGRQSHQGAMTAAIGHHRDSWGSNIQSQQNWWAPLYPLEPERSITFYPDYWQQPLANNTAQWRFADYLQSRKHTAAERQVAYPSAPQPTETVDESAAVRIMLEPGDVLNFASAHLHASALNTTQATRFSVEMRTVHIPDLHQQRQAPNIDNQGEPAMYPWFKSIDGGVPLSERLEGL